MHFTSVSLSGKLLPTPNELTLDEINQRFASDETAREYIESLLWPHGAVCPHCKNADAKSIWKIQANPAKKIRAGLHRCAKCDKEFTVTVGTIFEDSHIPLRKWLIAWYLICSSKKGISSLQLQRHLGLGQLSHGVVYDASHPARDFKTQRSMINSPARRSPTKSRPNIRAVKLLAERIGFGFGEPLRMRIADFKNQPSLIRNQHDLH